MIHMIDNDSYVCNWTTYCQDVDVKVTRHSCSNSHNFYSIANEEWEWNK